MTSTSPPGPAAAAASSFKSVPLPVRTCTSCQSSKVRCDGNLPCSRCAKRSTNCVYVSKRVRKMVEQKATDSPPRPIVARQSASEPDIDDFEMALLAPHQKVCLRVLFVMYHDYASPCMRFFFERRLRRLHKHLEVTKSETELEMLRHWLEKLNVDIFFEQGCPKECPGACHPGEKTSGLKAPLSAAILSESSSDDFLPTLELSEFNTRLGTNAAFNSTFELDANDLVQSLGWTGGTGLLPWGGDLLARLGAPVDELVAYILLMSIKICATPSPSAGDSRIICLVHQFVLQGRPTLAKVHLTEHFRRCASVVSDVAFSFEPLVESRTLPPIEDAEIDWDFDFLS